MDIIIDKFTPYERNTLKGFITLILKDAKNDFEMFIPGFTLHEKDGRRWIEVPGRPPTNPEKDKTWGKVCDFYDKRKEKKFKQKLMKALDKYLSQENTNLSETNSTSSTQKTKGGKE